MPHDVFVSHSVKDKDKADVVCAELEGRGLRCWVAPRDVPPGADWGEAILRAISESRVMVLVLSSSANASPHVKREAERAVNKGVTIIPFRVEDVTPAGSLEYFLGTQHWVDGLTPPLEAHARRLAESIAAMLGQPPPAEARTGGPAGSPPRGTPLQSPAAPPPRAAEITPRHEEGTDQRRFIPSFARKWLVPFFIMLEVLFQAATLIVYHYLSSLLNRSASDTSGTNNLEAFTTWLFFEGLLEPSIRGAAQAAAMAKYDQFFGRWVWATVAGSAATFIFNWSFSSYVAESTSALTAALFVGPAQWAVLRGRVEKAWLWVVAFGVSRLAYAALLPLKLPLGGLISGVLAALVTGAVLAACLLHFREREVAGHVPGSAS